MLTASSITHVTICIPVNALGLEPCTPSLVSCFVAIGRLTIPIEAVGAVKLPLISTVLIRTHISLQIERRSVLENIRMNQRQQVKRQLDIERGHSQTPFGRLCDLA